MMSCWRAADSFSADILLNENNGKSFHLAGETLSGKLIFQKNQSVLIDNLSFSFVVNLNWTCESKPFTVAYVPTSITCNEILYERRIHLSSPVIEDLSLVSNQTYKSSFQRHSQGEQIFCLNFFAPID